MGGTSSRASSWLGSSSGRTAPAVRETRDGYVAWPAPLGEDEEKRAQADGAVGRVQVGALLGHRFQKHSESCPLWQRCSRNSESLYLVKLDNPHRCRHT